MYLVLIFCLTSACAQTIVLPKHVKGKKYEGYIFSKDYTSTLLHLEDVKSKYTPTEEDVSIAENILENQIKPLNHLLVNQGGNCPVIHKILPRYKRQYIGYLDQDGNKIIWINFIGGKEKSDSAQLSKDVFIMFDGCSYYWNIKVNLSKKHLYDLHVNGSA